MRLEIGLGSRRCGLAFFSFYRRFLVPYLSPTLASTESYPSRVSIHPTCQRGMLPRLPPQGLLRLMLILAIPVPHTAIPAPHDESVQPSTKYPPSFMQQRSGPSHVVESYVGCIPTRA
jgi:hypothetical protein